MYTRAFADLLIRTCASEDGFVEVVGRHPRSKQPE